jgi:hypothetical protein
LTDENREMSKLKSFNYFFYAFAIAFLGLVVWNKGLTVESAHALIMMVLTRAIGQNYKDWIIIQDIEEKLIEVKEQRDLTRSMIQNLNLRVLGMEGYPDETGKIIRDILSVDLKTFEEELQDTVE